MVWKRLKSLSLCVCFVLILCVALTGQAQASSYTPYTAGNIGSTQLIIFRDIVSQLPINDNYVAVRTGQYEYKLFAGAIKVEGSDFTADTNETIKVYTIDTNSSSYNSTYVYTVNTEQDFNLSASNYLVYSNIGDFPSLEERGVIYAFTSVIILCVIGLCMLIRPLFAFVLRYRS